MAREKMDIAHTVSTYCKANDSYGTHQTKTRHECAESSLRLVQDDVYLEVEPDGSVTSSEHNLLILVPAGTKVTVVEATHENSRGMPEWMGRSGRETTVRIGDFIDE